MLEPATDGVEASVVRLLATGQPETPDDLVEKVEKELPALAREDVKDELISLLNRGILQLTLEGRLRLIPK